MRGEPRTRHINVRLTPEERAAIEARSSSFGMPPSTFMREAALLCREKPVRVASPEELAEIRTLLKRQGGLLNQLMRVINTYGLEKTELPAVMQAVGNVSDAASNISKLLAAAERRSNK